MTAQNHEQSLQQLNEVVVQLAATVTASERRYASLARAVRWGALLFIVLVATAAYVASDMVKAYAAQAVPWPYIEDQIAEDPPKLDDIMASLASTREIQGALVKVLQSAGAIATLEKQDYLDCVQVKGEYPRESKELCYARTGVEDLTEFFVLVDENNKPLDPTSPEYKKRVMEGMLMAGGQVLVDAAALVHRLRRDSDFFRETVNKLGGTNELLQGIKTELNHMNGMLAAIPPMGHEVHLMNRHMSVMTYSMGSTMGRMGSIIPW